MCKAENLKAALSQGMLTEAVGGPMRRTMALPSAAQFWPCSPRIAQWHCHQPHRWPCSPRFCGLSSIVWPCSPRIAQYTAISSIVWRCSPRMRRADRVSGCNNTHLECQRNQRDDPQAHCRPVDHLFESGRRADWVPAGCRRWTSHSGGSCACASISECSTPAGSPTP